MKHKLLTASIALASAFILIACQEKEQKLVQTTGLSLDKSSVVLNVGEVVELNAKIAPENASSNYILWETDNAKVATVDNFGRVQGVYPGKAVISAVSQADKKIKAVCNVTVNPIPAQSIKINAEKESLSEDESTNLTVEFTPANATYQDIEWSIDDSKVAEITPDKKDSKKAVLKGWKEGTVKVSAVSKNETEIKASIEIPITLRIPTEPSTEDLWKDNKAGHKAIFGGKDEKTVDFLSYKNGIVSWSENTTGKGRKATMEFSTGSKITVFQFGPEHFKGNYSITAKFFSKCDWIKSTDNNKPGELKNIVFGDPLRGEKLKDVDGMEYTNMIGIKGLYYEAVCDATVVIDYENKIVKLGVFLDARNNAQKVNNKVTGYNYACFLPGMGTGTGTTWAAPWNFVQPDLSSKEETDYTWLWFNCSEDLQSFNFNPSKAGQTLNTDLAGSAKQICAITVAVSKSAKVKGSDVNPNWNAVYQGNTFKVDTRHGVTFWRD